MWSKKHRVVSAIFKVRSPRSSFARALATVLICPFVSGGWDYPGVMYLKTARMFNLGGLPNHPIAVQPFWKGWPIPTQKAKDPPILHHFAGAASDSIEGICRVFKWKELLSRNLDLSVAAKVFRASLLYLCHPRSLGNETKFRLSKIVEFVICSMVCSKFQLFH